MMENRTKERFDVSLTARLQGSAAQQEIRISDLSDGGCYVDSIAEVFVGEAMLIRILVARDNWLEVEGIVAHLSRGLGFGVRFVNLDDRLRRVILSLIQRANPSLQKDPKGSWRLVEINASAKKFVHPSKLHCNHEQITCAIN